MRSELLKLNYRDLLKGFILAIITAITTYLYEVIKNGDLTTFRWETILTTAVIAAVGYLTKNLLTNSDGEIATAERKGSL